MPSTSVNYELWDTNTFLGVMRDVEEDPLYWMQWFTKTVETDATGYIDFEKMPILNRKLAPFVLPEGRGKSVYDDSSTAYRFKPAYVKVHDEIDPLMPLTRRVGIDSNMSQVRLDLISPMQRLDLIRAAMTASHVRAIKRTHNYMAAVALRDGKITLTGDEYPTTLVDFQRDAGHTITLGAGDRFGDAGVSILHFLQLVIDTMSVTAFGAVPVRVTMGANVWAVMRKDAEFKALLDLNYSSKPLLEYERGLYTAAGQKVFRVGTIGIGGASGQIIELWVDNSTYLDPQTNASTRYLGSHQMLFTGTAEDVMGHQAFGAIKSRAASYMPLEIFGQNWLGPKPQEVEYIQHESAPLMVPINPNATLLANVLAP